MPEVSDEESSRLEMLLVVSTNVNEKAALGTRGGLSAMQLIVIALIN
jgi:muramoyltetrapeptide carboxypeptidase LdcA involved in peptidoglycan recycling